MLLILAYPCFSHPEILESTFFREDTPFIAIVDSLFDKLNSIWGRKTPKVTSRVEKPLLKLLFFIVVGVYLFFSLSLSRPGVDSQFLLNCSIVFDSALLCVLIMTLESMAPRSILHMGNDFCLANGREKANSLSASGESLSSRIALLVPCTITNSYGHWIAYIMIFISA